MEEIENFLATLDGRLPPGFSMKREVRWENGMPIAKDLPVFKKEAVSEVALISLAMPYEGDEPEFQGLSNLEVTFIQLAKKSASGDLPSINAILDRAVGKPKQTSENLNASISLTELVKQWVTNTTE